MVDMKEKLEKLYNSGFNQGLNVAVLFMIENNPKAGLFLQKNKQAVRDLYNDRFATGTAIVLSKGE